MKKRIDSATEQIKIYKDQFMLKVTGEEPKASENIPEPVKRSGPLVHPNMAEFQKQNLSEMKKRATQEEFAEFTRKNG